MNVHNGGLATLLEGAGYFFQTEISNIQFTHYGDPLEAPPTYSKLVPKVKIISVVTRNLE